MAPPSDDALMRRLEATGADREEAFRLLVERHAAPLTRYVRAVLGEPAAAADDVVQEVFLRVYQARERYRPGGAPFRAWLLRIGRNLALNARRDGARRGAAALAEEAEADPRPGPVGTLVGRQRAARVRAAIARLPERDQEVLTLRYRQGLGYAAVAEVLGLQPAAAKQRGWRALKRLRAELGEEAAE